jgi:hypothetical protein
VSVSSEGQELISQLQQSSVSTKVMLMNWPARMLPLTQKARSAALISTTSAISMAPLWNRSCTICRSTGEPARTGVAKAAKQHRARLFFMGVFLSVGG